MRLIMMGTGPFAVPTFRALYSAGHHVAALVSAPPRTHRGKPVEPISDIREVAAEHGTPIFDPEDVNAPEAKPVLASFAADLLVVCDYGQILTPGTLAAARHGGVNLHASLLPKYRGAAPINWAIYHGETETGVTVIHMTPQLDAGPCIAQSRAAIGPDETAGELEVRLAEVGASLICEAIERIASGRATPLPQDAAQATKAPRLKKTDGQIDWSRPAAAIKNHIRAMEPWPRTYTFWRRPGGPAVRLILGPVSVGGGKGVGNLLPERPEGCCAQKVPDPFSAAPGTVLEATGHRLLIAAGQGAIAPQSIQPAGKRLMTIEEFLRGYPVNIGERFGGE